MTKTWKKAIALTGAVAMLVPALASCGGSNTKIDKENPAIDIMTKAFQAESAAPTSPVVEKLQEVVGAKLNINWAPSTSYDEKVTTNMGSGTYPHAMLVGARSSSVIQAARNGVFWDITDKIANYENLAQADPQVNHNISIDGKIYGIYRARELGRAGVSIRKDWLDNLGLDQPKTMDDLYNVLKAFTENDPDKNGQNDTYGMIVTDYLAGPLNNIAIWMGAPNEWGVDENGELAPAFTFDEYTEALKFFRKCYEEKLINADMATYSSDKWNEQFLSGQAGVIIDVADRARRLAQNMGEGKMETVDVFGYVTKDASTEPRTLPTTGYDGYYVFPTPSVSSEEDLDIVLNVMDKLNSEEAVNLMNYGIEGRNYELDDQGFVVKKDDPELLKEYADLNQLSMGIVTFEDGLKTKYTAPVAEKIDKVYEENRGYAVANPAAPYVSATYSKKGPQLDAIMEEAKVKFIVGDLDEAGYKAEIERWKSMGGADVIKEMNESYKADESVKK